MEDFVLTNNQTDYEKLINENSKDNEFIRKENKMDLIRLEDILPNQIIEKISPMPISKINNRLA